MSSSFLARFCVPNERRLADELRAVLAPDFLKNSCRLVPLYSVLPFLVDLEPLMRCKVRKADLTVKVSYLFHLNFTNPNVVKKPEIFKTPKVASAPQKAHKTDQRDLASRLVVVSERSERISKIRLGEANSGLVAIPG
jgi:hypothetical protein